VQHKARELELVCGIFCGIGCSGRASFPSIRSSAISLSWNSRNIHVVRRPGLEPGLDHSDTVAQRVVRETGILYYVETTSIGSRTRGSEGPDSRRARGRLRDTR
jgi:hypothetical protein